MRIRIIAALLVCCAPVVAWATPPAPHSAERQHRMAEPAQIGLRLLVRELLLRQYDTDHDGLLSPAENEGINQAAKDAMRQQASAVAAKFDLDRDGSLSPDEHREMKQALQAKRGKHAKRHHRHAQAENPTTTGSESAPQPRHKHRRHHRMGKKARMLAYVSHRLMLQAYDTDASGLLDEQEMIACRQAATELYTQRKAALLQRFDTDADGLLSEGEYNTARATLLPPQETDAAPRRRHLPPETFDDLFILSHLYPSACSRCTK